MPLFYETCNRPIGGLSLPHNAWQALRRENIENLDQLRTVVGQLQQLEGIGPKTARVIKMELARVAPFGEPTSC